VSLPLVPSEKYIRKLKPCDDSDGLVARIAFGYRYYGATLSRFDAILDDPLAHKEGWEAEYVRLADGSLFARSPERRNRFTQKNYDAYALLKKYGVVVFEYASGTLPEWYPKGDRYIAIVYGKGYKRTDATGPTEALAICRAVLLALVRRQRRKKKSS
jgi:hypothetical protein